MGGVKGLILCGGSGTRLRPITYYFQKSMIPIGPRQRPLLEYILRLLKFHGITELLLLVDYKHEQIVNYFDDGSRFNVRISYVKDEPSLKGTAGSILNAYKMGAISSDETLLVYYGDILTNLNIKELLNYHERKKALATVALALGFSVRVGLADLDDDGRIHKFIEKPILEKPVSIGIVVLNGEVLRIMEQIKGEGSEFDLMRDVIPYLIGSEMLVYGYLSNTLWYDVGSVEAYEKLDPKFVEESFSYLFG